MHVPHHQRFIHEQLAPHSMIYLRLLKIGFPKIHYLLNNWHKDSKAAVSMYNIAPLIAYTTFQRCFLSDMENLSFLS
jgi:hypothetical protein